MGNWVHTDWSCGCKDSYNFDRHEGGSYICNKGDACVQTIAARQDLVLLPPGDPDGQDA